MTPSPLVSVVLPARDAAATIRRALSSVFAQDYRPFEVIVVDDASRDTTADIVAALGHPTVTLLRRAAPGGAAAARNDGLAAARGEFVAFQDADDEWLPGKLSAQVALMLADPRRVFVACGCRFVDPDGRDLGPLYDGQVPQAGGQAWHGLLARNTIATPSVLARRDTLLALGGFDPALPVAEDQDMWIRLALHGHLGYLDAASVRVHATPGSLSAVGSAQAYAQQKEFTLPMVLGHLRAQGAALTARQRRRILGERWGRLGRTAYTYGFHAEGLRLVLRGCLLGFRPLENAWFLASAAPPARWLKRRLLGRA